MRTLILEASPTDGQLSDPKAGGNETDGRGEKLPVLAFLALKNEVLPTERFFKITGKGWGGGGGWKTSGGQIVSNPGWRNKRRGPSHQDTSTQRRRKRDGRRGKSELPPSIRL